MYELESDGSRAYDRALVGMAKGGGKTELAAAIACAELLGPTAFAGWSDDNRPVGSVRASPDIPVAAASRDQANLVFGAARVMLTHSPTLSSAVEAYEHEIRLVGRPGKLYRVAAEAATVDGLKPSFAAYDELHEWLGRTERVHLVLQNGIAKRRDAWSLAITTAGWDSTSLLGKLYAHGKRVQSGEAKDARFLFRWWEAEPGVDLEDEDERARLVAQALPVSFANHASAVARYTQVPEYEFRRYFLNQWTSSPQRWLPAGALEQLAKPGFVPPDGARIVIGFDGSHSRDATAIVGCTLDGHIFVIQVWERTARDGSDWRVPVLDVEAALEAACKRWTVERIGCDPYLWTRTLAFLESKGLPVEEWPSHQPSRMAPASTAFVDAVNDARLTLAPDERLLAHFANCVVKVDRFGGRPTKDHKDSDRRIDLAVAAIIAWDLKERVGAAAPAGPAEVVEFLI